MLNYYLLWKAQTEKANIYLTDDTTTDTSENIMLSKATTLATTTQTATTTERITITETTLHSNKTNTMRMNMDLLILLCRFSTNK